MNIIRCRLWKKIINVLFWMENHLRNPLTGNTNCHTLLIHTLVDTHSLLLASAPGHVSIISVAPRPPKRSPAMTHAPSWDAAVCLVARSPIRRAFQIACRRERDSQGRHDRNTYYWQNLKEDIRRRIQQCLNCQLKKLTWLKTNNLW